MREPDSTELTVADAQRHRIEFMSAEAQEAAIRAEMAESARSAAHERMIARRRRWSSAGTTLHRPAAPPPRRRSLLELDPDLASGLTAEQLRPASSGHLGLLVLEGVAVRELAVEDIVSSELVGPGELFVPWADRTDDPVLGEHVRWQVLSPLRVAIVDRAAVGAMASFPEITCALFERLAVHRAHGAALRAIGQLDAVHRRVVALLSHLAERWGRVTPDGTAIPLTLSHRLLAELIGARRPTVTTAVAKLTRSGEVARRADGTWLLSREASQR